MLVVSLVFLLQSIQDLERKAEMPTLEEKITAPTNMDTRQIFIVPIQEADSLLLMPLLKQDSVELELLNHLSTLITTQIRTEKLVGYTSTAGNTLTYE